MFVFYAIVYQIPVYTNSYQECNGDYEKGK